MGDALDPVTLRLNITRVAGVAAVAAAAVCGGCAVVWGFFPPSACSQNLPQHLTLCLAELAFHRLS